MPKLPTILFLFALSRAQAFSQTALPTCNSRLVTKSLVVCAAQKEKVQIETSLAQDMSPKFSRRNFVGALLAAITAPAFADGNVKTPESERIRPPTDSCAQGVGGKCEELSEGNPLIKVLQARSAKNRIKYQKEELESYWRKNYKDFFDYACTAYDKKCDFQENPDGTWTVGTKESGFKLKQAKDVTLLDQGLVPASK